MTARRATSCWQLCILITMKTNYILWSWLLRLVGIIVILPAIMPGTFVGIFPGLEDPQIRTVLLYVGFGIFLTGAVSFFVVRQLNLKRKPDRDQLDDIAEEKGKSQDPN